MATFDLDMHAGAVSRPMLPLAAAPVTALGGTAGLGGPVAISADLRRGICWGDFSGLSPNKGLTAGVDVRGPAWPPVSNAMRPGDEECSHSDAWWL